jgi:hypothetical protein
MTHNLKKKTRQMGREESTGFKPVSQLKVEEGKVPLYYSLKKTKHILNSSKSLNCNDIRERRFGFSFLLFKFAFIFSSI